MVEMLANACFVEVAIRVDPCFSCFSLCPINGVWTGGDELKEDVELRLRKQKHQ